MPAALFASEADGQDAETEDWANRMRERLERHGVVMAAIGDPQSTLPFPPQELAARLAGAVERLAARTRVDRIFLEGGATASAFLLCAGWDRLLAHSSSPSNLAALHPLEGPDIDLFIKPGSYDWPDWAWPTSPGQG
jgi:riboflavin biosynthesis pyrimidine reductase